MQLSPLDALAVIESLLARTPANRAEVIGANFALETLRKAVAPEPKEEAK